MKNKTNWNGFYEIKVIDETTKEEKTFIKNEIHDIGKKMMKDVLKGTITDGKIKYLAFGNSTASITLNDTQLGNETFRKAITNYYDNSDFELYTTTNILDTEANGQIEEIGIFAGSTASTTTNSGIMLSRVLWSYNKTSTSSILIKRIDTISGSSGLG